MISTLKDFVVAVEALEYVSDAYYIFEEECTPELRDQIYSLADKDSCEPFCSAMNFLGFEDY